MEGPTPSVQRRKLFLPRNCSTRKALWRGEVKSRVGEASGRIRRRRQRRGPLLLEETIA